MKGLKFFTFKWSNLQGYNILNSQDFILAGNWWSDKLLSTKKLEIEQNSTLHSETWKLIYIAVFHLIIALSYITIAVLFHLILQPYLYILILHLVLLIFSFSSAY